MLRGKAEYECNQTLFLLGHINTAFWSPDKLTNLMNPFLAERLITPEMREEDKAAKYKSDMKLKRRGLQIIAEEIKRRKARQQKKKT